jgi:TolB protein
VQRPVTTKAQGVSAPTWSPDGRRIAFISAGAIHVVNANGSGLRRLPAKTVLGRISWSAGSRRLAYTGAGASAGNGSVQIYVIDAARGAPRALAPKVQSPVIPSWSPRGTTIAFMSARTDAMSIYTIQADGSGLRTLTSGADDSFPSWSPDGRSILFERYTCPSPSRCGYQINVMRADGAMRRALIHVPRFPGAGGLSSAWSPDGRRILFLRPLGGLRGDEIVVMDTRGKQLRRLTKGVRDASDPAWSPDGRMVAYESSNTIYVVNADGSGPRRLVESGSMPAWKPR